MWSIVGLGNPREEYEKTRHNVGFMVADSIAGKDEWKLDSKKHSETLQTKIGTEKAILIKPQTFMNKSGSAVRLFATSKKKMEQTIVVHDDVDLPFGSIKIVFGRGSGGHRGVESIKRALKTKEFVRVRVGVAPTTPTGKIKKPKGEKGIHDFLLGEFSQKEQLPLKKIIKKVTEAIEVIVTAGLAKAMNQYN